MSGSVRALVVGEEGSGSGLCDPSGLRSSFRENLEVSQNLGYLFGGPHHKDYSILGSTSGSSYLGKLPLVFRA